MVVTAQLGSKTIKTNIVPKTLIDILRDRMEGKTLRLVEVMVRDVNLVGYRMAIDGVVERVKEDHGRLSLTIRYPNGWEQDIQIPDVDEIMHVRDGYYRVKSSYGTETLLSF